MSNLFSYKRNGVKGKPNYQVQTKYYVPQSNNKTTVYSKVPVTILNGPGTGGQLDCKTCILKAEHKSAFNARPLKIHRKQYSTNGTGKVSIGQINAPGGYIYNSNVDCADCSANTFVSENALQYNMSRCAYNGDANRACTYEVVAVNKARALTDNNTNISYSYNNSQYLKRKCLSYDQHNTHIPIKGKDYTFDMTNCYDDTCKTTTFNPSNRSFQVQGAVSSGGRIAKLKYDTIQTAAKGLDKHIWGPAAVNASTYSGRPDAPFINKSTYQDIRGCCCYKRPTQCARFRLF